MGSHDRPCLTNNSDDGRWLEDEMLCLTNHVRVPVFHKKRAEAKTELCDCTVHISTAKLSESERSVLLLFWNSSFPNTTKYFLIILKITLQFFHLIINILLSNVKSYLSTFLHMTFKFDCSLQNIFIKKIMSKVTQKLFLLN